MGGGAGNASIQLRNGVFTVLSIALCLGFPTKQIHEHHEKPNCSSTDKNTKEQKNLLLSILGAPGNSFWSQN